MSSLALPPLPLGVPVGGPARARPLPDMPPVTAATTPRPRPRPEVSAPLATETATRSAPPDRAPDVAPLPQRSPAPPRDYTDRELAEALRPVIGATALPNPDDFETLIRAAFRRTLAEHTGGPFDPPDLWHRAMWRLDALFSSRSFEETVDEKMRRFRIEEIHLLDRRDLALVSFASVNPARHADARKVQTTSGRLATMLAGRDHGEPGELPFSKKIRALVRPGEHTLLVALVRGRPDSLAGVDLDYALQRIESRYLTPLAEGEPLLQEIQPMLEECLLIHSPPAPIPN
ncbi:hypothetical protein [Haloferula sp. A504]|uniref:hypothetical protein n=1 Tax=Haloferula sp. A504 TaxID=3373601 RepID=UPI0031BCD0DA|nr:hypothetical protein [Verrucomicrobiaceae bacterium E54]